MPPLKLADFDMGAASAEPVMEFVGTPSSMAPEFFAFEPHHAPADVWSFGMVVQWLLLECQPPGNYEMQDFEGNTVHCLAAKNGHTSTVRFLVDLLKKRFDMKESRRRCSIGNNQG